MAKAMLIIDMPENCYKCQFRRYHSSRFSFSCGLIYGTEIEEEAEKRIEWCPLRPVPTFKEDNSIIYIERHEGYLEGWNDCVKEVLEGVAENGENLHKRTNVWNKGL